MDEHVNIPPQDIYAEQCVLGSMMKDEAAIPTVGRILKPEMFYRESHDWIYRTIMALAEKGMAVDVVTVKERLEQTKRLDRVGGPAYLCNAVDVVPTALNADKYAMIVREKYILRQIIQTMNVHCKRGYDGEDPLSILASLNAVTGEIAALTGLVDDKETPRACHAMLKQMLDASQGQAQSSGIPTGFEELDKDILIPNGEITVIAGRPGAGKTSLALQVSDYNNIIENPILFVSLEMESVALVRRVTSQRTGIPTYVITRGPEAGEAHKICMAAENIAECWKIIGRPSRDIDDIVHLIKYEYSRKRYAGVVIDLFSQITIDAIGKDFSLASRINKRLLSLAHELKTPVISVVQINRDVEQNKKPRPPRLSNLKGTGSHEEDAALVILIHRDEDSDNAEIIIAKNRFGPRGVYPARFFGGCQRFEIGARQ